MAVLGLLSALAGDPRLFAFAVPAGRYWMRVRAAGADGVSGPSTGLGVRVGCGAAFVAPANFVGNASGSAVTRSRAPVPGATGYLPDAGTAPIYGSDDASTLGMCSAAAHDVTHAARRP